MSRRRTLWQQMSWRPVKVVDLPKSHYKVFEPVKVNTRVIVTFVVIVIVSIAWALLV